ncbi:MAG: glycosyltransferase family 4 protein [Gemmatimonadota bacterium]
MAAPAMSARGAEPLRIALMIECDGPGGAELMILELAKELRERGHVVLPVGLAAGTGWLGARFVAAGFEPASFDLRRPIDLEAVRALTTILRDFRADVVHSHEFTMAIYGAAAARRAHARHVITMHGGLYYATAWRRRAALRWAMQRSAALVGVSDATAGALRQNLGISGSKVHVVPNGIPLRTGVRAKLRRELALAPGELLIVSVGNLYAVKGHAVLIDAMSTLRDLEGWRVVIAGRGEEEPRLRAQAAAAGIGDRVHLLGFRDDVADILAAGDIFTMPSLSEGLPLALVEGMSFGLPVVVTRVGGVPEVVTDGVEGLLVPPSDPAALANALRALLQDAPRRQHMGAAARTRAVRDYALSTMADRYERLYRGEAAG